MTAIVASVRRLDVENVRDWASRHRWLLAGVTATVAALALIAIASLPTGVDSPEQTVPDGSRLAAIEPVDDAHVLLVSRAGALEIHVAYDGPKGWLSVELPSAPVNAVAAWAGSPGEGPIPDLAAVYGRAAGAEVVVTWADGTVDRAELASDGVYLVARVGRVAPSSVEIVDADGEPVVEVGEL